MKTKECPSCAMEIDADSKVCPICQYEFPADHKVSYKLIAIFLVLIFLLFLLF